MKGTWFVFVIPDFDLRFDRFSRIIWIQPGKKSATKFLKKFAFLSEATRLKWQDSRFLH